MKKTYSALIAMTIMSLASASFADAPAPAPTPTPMGLGTKIEALVMASIHEFNDYMYQNDPYFPAGPNTSGSQAKQDVDAYSSQLTQQQITNQLSTIPEQAVPASQLSDQSLIAKVAAQKNLVQQLTVDTPASDTLYTGGNDNILAGIFGAPKPTTLYDNYFNFDSLIGPDAYSQSQLTAAQAYLQYLTQSYNSITPGIDFSGLKTKLISISDPITRAKWLRTQVLNNPTYQAYQLGVRSNMAARSVVLSNFNDLLSQRMPIKGLGTAAGIPQDPNLPNGYASSLEAQNYAALQLINNPGWYQSMKTASPATVDREQLLLLATLVRQQAQNEEYNQRLLATMSLLTLEMNQTQQLMMQTQAQKVNQIWSNNSTVSQTIPANNSQAGNVEAVATSTSGQ